MLLKHMSASNKQCNVMLAVVVIIIIINLDNGQPDVRMPTHFQMDLYVFYCLWKVTAQEIEAQIYTNRFKRHKGTNSHHHLAHENDYALFFLSQNRWYFIHFVAYFFRSFFCNDVVQPRMTTATVTAEH